MNKKSTVIVTRHQALIAWLAENGITGASMTHAAPEDVIGKNVYGVLPLHLAALAASVTVVDLPGLPEGKRGWELTKEEMVAAGATMTTYVVKKM
jgi:putative CRISPR-associated protein (TIGR02620 family)